MRIPAFACAVTCFVAAVHGTTVRPPTFDELVSDAELIFRGRVTEVRAEWAGQPGRRYVATLVTFAVDRALKGEAGESVTLQFMGGELEGQRFQLVGWPEFSIGDHGVFFVENRLGRVCPLVRLRHGRYRVVTTAGSAQEVVLRDDHTPLRNLTVVAMPLAENSAAARTPPTASGLTLKDFEMQVVERARLQRVPASIEVSR